VRRSQVAARLVLRAVLLVLALAHTLPAQKHLALFLAAPSLNEGWKGFGATAAVFVYLLPVRSYARVLGALWSRHRTLLVGGGWLLAIVHAVPAADHLPRLFAEISWADGWRGLGSSFACAWFIAPLRVQAAALVALRSTIAAAVRVPSAAGLAHISEGGGART
jgi:hypothetical protein